MFVSNVYISLMLYLHLVDGFIAKNMLFYYMILWLKKKNQTCYLDFMLKTLFCY